MWTARVFTLYPELFPGPLGIGLYKKALEKKQLAEIRKREKQERDKKQADKKKQRKL